jgi:hypothetical protein
MKQYKLTIVPYLNKELKIKLVNDNVVYPLYFRVTYMRQTTLIRSISEKLFSDIEDSKAKKIISIETLELENLINFLTEFCTEEFNLKGLKDKYLLSQRSTFQMFDDFYRKTVRDNISKIKNEKLITLNVGSYSEEYPLPLLVHAIMDYFPKIDKKLLKNTGLYLDYSLLWMDYYHIDKKQPRIIEFLKEYRGVDRDFLMYLSKVLKTPDKIKEFYYTMDDLIKEYLFEFN